MSLLSTEERSSCKRVVEALRTEAAGDHHLSRLWEGLSARLMVQLLDRPGGEVRPLARGKLRRQERESVQRVVRVMREEASGATRLQHLWEHLSDRLLVRAGSSPKGRP